MCAFSHCVVQLLARITASAGRVDQLIEAVRSVGHRVQCLGGCADVRVSLDVDDRNVVWYCEEWPAIEDFEAYLRSDRFGRLLAVLEVGAEAPLLECRLVSETRGLDYFASVRGVAIQDRASHESETKGS